MKPLDARIFAAAAIFLRKFGRYVHANAAAIFLEYFDRYTCTNDIVLIPGSLSKNCPSGKMSSCPNYL